MSICMLSSSLNFLLRAVCQSIPNVLTNGPCIEYWLLTYHCYLQGNKSFMKKLHVLHLLDAKITYNPQYMLVSKEHFFYKYGNSTLRKCHKEWTKMTFSCFCFVLFFVLFRFLSVFVFVCFLCPSQVLKTGYICTFKHFFLCFHVDHCWVDC